MFPLWLQAAFWGLVGGSALLIGAVLGYFARIPQRAIRATHTLRDRRNYGFWRIIDKPVLSL